MKNKTILKCTRLSWLSYKTIKEADNSFSCITMIYQFIFIRLIFCLWQASVDSFQTSRFTKWEEDEDEDEDEEDKEESGRGGEGGEEEEEVEETWMGASFLLHVTQKFSWRPGMEREGIGRYGIHSFNVVCTIQFDFHFSLGSNNMLSFDCTFVSFSIITFSYRMILAHHHVLVPTTDL